MERAKKSIISISEISINRYLLDIFQIIFGVIILFLSAFIYIYIPGNPVPITMQVFSVLMIASIYSKKNGMLAILFYILFGVSGAPIFAGASGGLLYLTGPTGGYLFGFVAAVYLINFFKDKIGLFLSLSGGLLFIYLFGWLRLSIFMNMNFSQAFFLGVLTFLPYDIIKLLVVYILAQTKKVV